MRPPIVTFIFIVFWPCTAFAFILPSTQGWLAELLIIPLALFLYILSGAAGYYDKKTPEGTGSGRRTAVLVYIFALFMSVGMVIIAIVASTFMALYAVILGVNMLSVKKDQNLYLGVWVPRIAGALLIPMAVLLAGFNFALGPIWHRQNNYSLHNSLRNFSYFQNQYALEHGGKYMKVPLKTEYCEKPEGVDDVDLYNNCGALGAQASEYWLRFRKNEISYSADMKSYEIRITPIEFPVWPYNHLVPRRAFFMNQAGEIRSTKMFGPGDGSPGTPSPF